MATTLSGDVFIPEVATAVATAQFPDELAFGLAGSRLVMMLPAVDAIGIEGDQIKFPRWNPLGEFDDMTEDVAITPEKLDSSLETAPVVVGGKAAEVTDFATLASRGDPSTEVGTQIAQLAARYVDTKLIDKANLTPLVQDISGASNFASFDTFIDAVQAKWGDKAMKNVGGLIVTSASWARLAKSTEFKDKDFSDRNDIQDGTLVGLIANYPVFVSDRLTIVAGDSHNLILKAGALGLKFQRQLLVERDRDVLKKNWVISADVRFAVHQLFGEPRTIIKWITDH